MCTSQLHDEHTFYQKFLKDLEKCTNEVIIESPYITIDRFRTFDRLFEKLLNNNVKIYIVTRDPREHDEYMFPQAERAIAWCEQVGVQVFLIYGNLHRKLALLDRKILWEGSLNILSQAKSREVMRRIDDPQTTQEMLDFLKLEKFL